MELVTGTIQYIEHDEELSESSSTYYKRSQFHLKCNWNTYNPLVGKIVDFSITGCKCYDKNILSIKNIRNCITGSPYWYT